MKTAFILLFSSSAIFAQSGQKFDTIQINDQIWMANNLDINKFRNGDIIPQAKTKDEWVRAAVDKQPAWCYYENDPVNGGKYGKLYNWFAVTDLRGLAPAGWHIPRDEEWTTLINYLGGELKAGVEMKAKTGWFEEGNGTNNSRFSGLPGGARHHLGFFFGIGKFGNWWSTTSYSRESAYWRFLADFHGSVVRVEEVFGTGLSVRCLRD